MARGDGDVDPVLVIMPCLTTTPEDRNRTGLRFPFAWRFGRGATVCAGAASANFFSCLRSCIYR